jgi:AcrR family transcriptional regulator
MARIAREAGMSVGALYARFPEKHTYLYRVVGEGFRRMKENAKSALERNLEARESASASVERIVRHVVGAMTDRKAAGVIRAALKLATVKPETIELLGDYRKLIADRSAALLSAKLHRTRPQTVRIAVQIVLGTVTDAILQKKAGPMNAGSTRMVNALTNVMQGYLGLSGGSWAWDESEGEDMATDIDELSEEPSSNAAVPTFDPEYRQYVRKRPSGKKKAPSVESGPRRTERQPAKIVAKQLPRTQLDAKPVAKVKAAKPPRVPVSLKPPEPPPKPRQKPRVV